MQSPAFIGRSQDYLKRGTGPATSRPSLLFIRLDCQCHGVSAAEAERGDAALGVAPGHFVEQGHEDAGAGGADGMAQCHGAAVYVGFCRVEAQLLYDGDGLDGKGFVQFEQIYVL